MHSGEFSPRVLLVEDHPQIRKLFRLLLDAAGYEMLEAESRAAALETLASSRPDVVLLDLSLPDGNGFDLAEEIRAIAPGQKIIIVSAGLNERMRQKAEAFTGNPTIDKLSASRLLVPTLNALLSAGMHSTP